MTFMITIVLLLATAVVVSDRLVEMALKMREEQVPASLGESLTSITSLLQLSLLREMMTNKKDCDKCSSIGTATPDEIPLGVDHNYQQCITFANITDSIQQAIDERIANIENQQRSLQNQMTAISSQLTSIENAISMLQNTHTQLLSKP